MRFQRRHLLPWPDRRTYAILSTLLEILMKPNAVNYPQRRRSQWTTYSGQQMTAGQAFVKSYPSLRDGNNSQQAPREMEAELQTYIE